MSISWHLDAETAPALLVVPPAAVSLDEAHAAIELWEHYSGKVLDPAQRLTVEVMMAQGADGRWAAATTGREMPRQNGKGDEVEVVELWGLVQRAEAILHTVHDAVLLASQAQQRMLGVLEGNADLRRRVKRKWQGTGQQMIELRNGAVIWYRTRTSGGGRGVDDVDRLVVDEAQHATEEHLSAVAPTLLANANPQLNALGTAGLAGKSGWWWSVRRRALSPDPGAFGYVGHTAEDVSVDAEGRVIQHPVDIDDRRLWRRANPSVVAGRGQGLEFLEEQLRRLGPAAFAREHLGVWDPPVDAVSGWQVVAEAVWVAARGSSRPSGPLSFALDVDTNTQGEEWCSIVASDGVHVEVVEVPQATVGLGWVVPKLVERRDEFGEMWLDASGPAGKLVAPLEKAGVVVRRVKREEIVQACGQFKDAVEGGELVHSNQTVLNRAVAGAKRRDVGDGAWRFSRTLSSVDISPLMAACVARFAAVATPEPAEVDFVMI